MYWGERSVPLGALVGRVTELHCSYLLQDSQLHYMYNCFLIALLLSLLFLQHSFKSNYLNKVGKKRRRRRCKVFCHCIYNILQSKKGFNGILTVNARYRGEIESLRVERQRFDNLYKKLDKELTNLRREKGELIESSTQAYDSRWGLNRSWTRTKTICLESFDPGA